MKRRVGGLKGFAMRDNKNAQRDEELKALTAAVESAIKARKDWMDANMAHYAKFKVGDEIYDRRSGLCLGVVTKLYRYWGSQNDPRHDTSMNVEYEYRQPGSNFIDNTSSRGSFTDYAFATREEMAAEFKARAERMATARS